MTYLQRLQLGAYYSTLILYDSELNSSIRSLEQQSVSTMEVQNLSSHDNNVSSNVSKSITKKSSDKANFRLAANNIPIKNAMASGPELGSKSKIRKHYIAENHDGSFSPCNSEIGSTHPMAQTEHHAETGNSSLAVLPLLWNEERENTELDLYAADASPRTYPKNLLRLCFSFPAERRDQIIQFLVNLPEENVHKLTAFLKNLTDRAYEDVVGRLTLVNLPRCQTYLEIFASYCVPPMANVPYKCSVHSDKYDTHEDYPYPQRYQESDVLQDDQWDGELASEDSWERIYTEYDDHAGDREAASDNGWERNHAEYYNDAEDDQREREYFKDADSKPLDTGGSTTAPDSMDGDQVHGGSADTDSLIRRIHDLPSELYDQILVSVLDVSFRPGKIFPQQDPTCYGYHCMYGRHYADPEPTVFLALPRVLYPRIREECWSGNTWVVGAGSPFYTVEFLKTIPESMRDMIRSVHITFTSEDLYGFEGMCLHGRIRQEIEQSSKDGKVDNLEVLERFRKESDSFETEVTQIWFDKFYALSCLSLKNLTIDMTKAHAPDGTFLGLEQVKLFPPFSDGMPRLTILAPTRSLEDDIWEVFARNNPRRNY